MAGDFEFEDLKDAHGRAEAIKVLNDYLKTNPPRSSVRSCSILIGAHPGAVEDIYGGVCELQNGRKVVLCGDTGVGEFGARENGPVTRAAVVAFTRQTCPGG